MSLNDQLDRLARMEPVPYPVVSLYLNAQPNERGRDQFQIFVRQEFNSRSETYSAGSPDRESLDSDVAKISTWLENSVDPSANGIAIFACSAAGLFETVQITAPIEQHWLYIGDAPHLYPLARLVSQYPRYAAVVADTNTARILTFSTGGLVTQRAVQGQKTRRTSQGGWSQARFQRHTSNFHAQHAKEVVEALGRIVAQEDIDQIILACDEVVLPLLQEQMPKELAAKVIDHVRLDTRASVDEVLEATRQAMRRLNDRNDREKVEAALNGYRSGMLGAVGPEATMQALLNGQVDELLVSANVDALRALRNNPRTASVIAAATANDSTLLEAAVQTVAAGEAAAADPQVVRLADELVTRAAQTGARVTFIEDASLLRDHGGVAALLRYRI